MALSRVTIPGDGVTTVFPVSFALGIINENDVTARVGDEVDGLGDPVYRTITFNSPELLEISGAPAGVGIPVVFERTVEKDELLVDYEDGDIINDDNLNTAQKQALMLIHELFDGRFDAIDSDINLGGHRITNMGDPIDDQDAATKKWTIDQLIGAGIGVPVDQSVTMSKLGPDVIDRFEALETFYLTMAAAISADIPSDRTYVELLGYLSPGVGGGKYIKVGAEPAHTGKFQSADGAWWELKETTVTPQMFGGTNVGMADESVYSQRAADYLTAIGGGKLVYAPGKYRIVGIAIGSTTNVIIDTGALLEQANGTNNVFDFEGILGAPVLLTGTVGRGSTQIPLASTTGIAAGDWLIITDTVDYSAVSDAIGYKSGQSVIVESVSGLNVNITSPLLGSMQAGATYTVANGARIQKITPLEDISFDGGGRITLLQTTNTNGIYARYVNRLRVSNIRVDHFAGSGVFPRDCINVDVNDCIIEDGLDNVGAGFPGYGICVGGACDITNIHDNIISRVRHGVTTIGGTTGFPINLEIYDNLVYDPSFIGLDTHASGMNINIENNSVTGGVIGGVGAFSPGGIATRTGFTRIINNDLSNFSSTAIAFSGEDLESITISGNKIRRTGIYGITGSVACPQLTITDNVIEDIGHHGISVFGADTVASPRLYIARNKINGIGQVTAGAIGISYNALQTNLIQIIDNDIQEDGKSAGNASRAIYLGTLVSPDSVISRNTAAGTYSGVAFDFGSNSNLGNFDNILLGKPRNFLWSIANNGVKSIPCLSGLELMILIGSASAGATFPNGLFRARPNASPHCAGLTTFGANVVFTAGALTGTTGTVGNFTISVDDGNLYFENRTGSTSPIWIEIMGPVVA